MIRNDSHGGTTNMVKWLRLAQPSVSLNAPNVKLLEQKYTQVIPLDATPVAIVRDYVPPDARHLIVNCHGNPDPAIMLGTRIHADDVDAFEPIAAMPDLKMIWFSACNIAGSTKGHNFCKKLAAVARVYVVAHTASIPDRKCKTNCIEDYIYAMRTVFKPNGELHNPEKFYDELGEWGGFQQYG